MLSLLLMVVLVFLFVLSSGKAVQIQCNRRVVKRRLGLVSVNPEPETVKSLFDWDKRTGTVIERWQRLYQRIDALFGQSGKRWLISVLFVVALVVWFGGHVLPLSLRVGAVVIVVALTVLLLYWVMRVRQHREFEDHFPQVLGQISRAVAAGISVPQAITQVSEYQRGMLGREFGLIRDQLEIGISLKHALEDAHYRLPYSGFHFFVVALILNEENGGQLREVLHSLSRTLYNNITIKMKIKSLTAEPRTTAAILAALPVFLICVMFFKNPGSFIQLTQTDAGQWVLTYVVGSIAAGLAVINALTRVGCR